MKAIELFAGVGGFRLGLDAAGWETVFSNQWEPSTKKQHASEVYVHRFGSAGHTNEDIAVVADSALSGDGKWKIPKADLLVGGFPCQDYSVAKSASAAHGIAGKKGVLWWEILKVVEHSKPKFIFLENVDRLLKSPTSQRGRDFAIMLSTLSGFGYSVEWRVINAAEYGFPQRRRRIYIVAKRTGKKSKALDPVEVISNVGVFARAFPISEMATEVNEISISDDPVEVTKSFNANGKLSPFENAGYFVNGTAWTAKVTPKFIAPTSLGELLVDESQVPEEYFVSPAKLGDWKYLKGAKKEERVHRASGTKYFYNEGSMAFPDPLDAPARTILTGEGGSSPSRFKHVVQLPSGRYRRLMPIELERINGFPDGWTEFGANGERISDVRRAFFMGNALVVGIIERIGRVLKEDF